MTLPSLAALCGESDLAKRVDLSCGGWRRWLGVTPSDAERKEVPSSNEGKKGYWTSKSVVHVRITGESRSQSQSHKSRSTLRAVLEDTMHLVDLFLSAFAPSWIAMGSMRSISMTIAHPVAQVAGCSGALRTITVGAEIARSRVLAGPRDSGRHFVPKCSHCACSVSHERGPIARS